MRLRARASEGGWYTDAMDDKPAEMGKPAAPDALESYNRVAETIGGIPTLRWRDNVIQAAVVVGAGIVGAMVGAVAGGGIGALIGGVVGVVAATFISGVVLMVLGWVRAARKR